MPNRKSGKKEKRLEDKIKEFIVMRLSLPMEASDIRDHQHLFGDSDDSLHLDSVDALELSTGVTQEFDIILEEKMGKMDLTFLSSMDTVSKIAEFIRKNMPDLLIQYADYEVDQ